MFTNGTRSCEGEKKQKTNRCKPVTKMQKKDAATAFEMKRNIHINSMSVIYCMQDASNERIRGKKACNLNGFPKDWFPQFIDLSPSAALCMRLSLQKHVVWFYWSDLD